MKKLVLLFLIVFCASFLFAQGNSMVFYNGELVDDMIIWPWGYAQDPVSVSDMGYTPGTEALQWITYSGGDQGVWLGPSDYVSGVDFSATWETDSVYFMLRAPEGLEDTDSLYIWLYDENNSDWNYALYCKLDSFPIIDDGEWHQFSMALKDFLVNVNEINKANIVAVSFETTTGIASEMYIDKVWIGEPELPITMTFYNGQSLANGIEHEAWGFNDNSLILAEGEGYLEGTPAILWETANWDWQGQGFMFVAHDFTHSMTVDTLRIKIKAPAGINDLALDFYDLDYNTTWATARYVLDAVAWDGEWQILEVPLADFYVPENFDLTRVYEFAVVADDTTIPERILIDDIWIGTPYINTDLVAPSPPAVLTVSDDPAYPNINLIVWQDSEGETGETYDVFFSSQAITDLTDENVLPLVQNIEEGECVVAHHIFYPAEAGERTYYYAISCTDAAGNVSETFTVSEPFTNMGKKRGIISYGAPENFVVDGYFDEWEEITPFEIDPENGLVVSGVVESVDDYSALCYIAIDNENLYIGFDVVDDAFTWQSSNTVEWWNDESIEFFIGLYGIIGSVSHHNYWGREDEPDYRIVFRPEQLNIDAWPYADSIMAGTENYYFESGGSRDYFIETKIPLAMLSGIAGDNTFTPVKGMKIPLEIQCNDADVVNGGTVARVQLGANTDADPWWSNPDMWTFTWIGLPDWLGVEDGNSDVVLKYSLQENYPNPFNPTTTINYSIPKTGDVTLCVYNTLGQRVKTIVNAEQTAGRYSVHFDASNLASGIYFYQINADKFSKIKKMVLIK